MGAAAMPAIAAFCSPPRHITALASVMESPVNRRSFLSSTAVAVTAATAATVANAEAKKEAASSSLSKTIEECLSAAYACRELCLATLQKGDTMMAACMRTVSDMIPLCQATAQLAASKSKHLKKTVAACLDACIECEAECKKHASMHAECKACLDACTACVAACKKV